MRRVKGANTSVELEFRRAIWRTGLRYQVGRKDLAGKPDIVFPSSRLLVFVDGDFWHGYQWARRGLSSLAEQFAHARNRSYWIRKIQSNVHRDFANTASLLESGWRVLRFWESDISTDLEQCVDMVLRATRGEFESNPNCSELPRFTVAEFFAGIGLVRLALEAMGWSVVFASDIARDKFEMYKANFGEEHFVLGDIHDLSGDDVPRTALATASFPCNDLSLAGAMAGLNGSQSGAFWGFVRVLRELKCRRPPMILVENVPGFLSSHGGRDFEAALLSLNELGYTCDAFMLNAVNFVPQSRDRLFVVGSLRPPRHWSGSIAPTPTRPKPLLKFIEGHPDIRWEIRPLPDPPRRATRLDDILEDLSDDDPTWWSHKRAEYFMNQLSKRHSAIAKLMIERPHYSYGTAFRRIRHGKSMVELRADGVAGCLRTPRGGSGRQILFKAGCGKYWVRLLTPRECARLMGVADSYEITVKLNEALFGFGDAVCVPAIEWISENYLIPLATEMLRGQVLTEIAVEAGNASAVANELSQGDQREFMAILKDIIERYNRRLTEVETDISIKIEIE